MTIFGEILIDGGSREGFIWSIVRWPTLWVLLRESVIAALALASLRMLDGVRALRQPELADLGVEEDLA